jgi:hypothetical protein
MAKAAPPHAISDWGTPDPREANAYPSESAPMVKWAWEFLRRSEDYRRRWERLTADYGDKKISETEKGRQIHWRSPTDVLRAEFRICPYTAPGMNNTLDPADSRPPLFEGAEILYEIEVQPEPIKPPGVLIEFDASLPIEPQLDNARRLLHARAKQLPSRPRDARLPIGKFRTYLRLLDFQDEGATDREIGEHLFQGAGGERLRNLIRDNFEAARRWQHDYLLIALHSPANS